MTADTSAAITRDRLFRWAARLKTLIATPAIMISIGHGKNSGEVVVTCVEDLPKDVVIGFLRQTLALLEASAFQDSDSQRAL